MVKKENINNLVKLMMGDIEEEVELDDEVEEAYYNEDG
jgi:hypothetical protein